MNPRQNAAFTWVEALVCLGLIGIIAALALPEIIPSRGRNQTIQSLSNMRQLHLATQQMALDGESSGDRALGWPGDTGGTFSSWVTKLVPEYLSTNDLCKLLSGPGVVVPPGKLPSAMRECAVRVYAVGTNSPETAVFLTSANFTNTPEGGAPLEKSAKPYGDKGFVVFRKGGDGAILLKTQVGRTNLIGSFVPLLK